MPLPWECYPHVISLGAGVQSSVMALMASEGLITPMPRAAIFADTQAEPASVYKWLEWLESQLAFPVIRVTRGNLATEALRLRISKNNIPYAKHAPPAFILDTDGRQGLLMRQCTEDFKLSALHRGMRRYTRDGSKIVQWIGISTDEAHRMKPSRQEWLISRWPLIDAGISRKECLEWAKAHGLPEPPRSACVMCPYHSDSEWIRLRDHEPEEFAKAVLWETEFQETMTHVHNFRGRPFLHRSMIPLSEVKFKGGEGERQFGNECEGMCGV